MHRPPPCTTQIVVTQIAAHRFHDPLLFACKCKNACRVAHSFRSYANEGSPRSRGGGGGWVWPKKSKEKGERDATREGKFYARLCDGNETGARREHTVMRIDNGTRTTSVKPN